ncbi:MAG: isochorismate synthase [Acidimicrobiia bacterium]|nr:isochorismate synthase [Acidimicrobiia bacterium]
MDTLNSTSAEGLTEAMIRVLDASLPASLDPTPPTSSLVVWTTRAEPEVDPLAIVAGADHEDTFFWQIPVGNRSFVGIGQAWETTSDGVNRFKDLDAAIDHVRDTTTLVGEPISPTLGAGFAFAEASDWNALPPALARLPRLAHVQDGEDSYWQIATRIGEPGSTRSERIARELITGMQSIMDLAATPLPKPIAIGAVPTPGDDPAYRKLVSAGLKSIHRGEFDKVVLARSVDTPATPALGPLLARLRQQHPEAATFAVGNGVVFCGATPELLVRWSAADETATSAALAGTTRRGTTEAEDASLAAELLNDPKQLAEHQFVVDHLLDRFSSSGMEPRSSATDLMKLSNVQHLRTAVVATGSVPDGVLGLADQLHPTPAVGGTPDSTALDFINRHEGLDRGWYAGPVGIVTLDGDGEFWVALRCALLEKDHTTLFAGAGIVAGSDPDSELEETTLKLQNLGALIGLT